MFKIFNKKTNLFSMGGSYPRWSKNGKIWATKAALSNHLALINAPHFYKDCVINELDMVCVAEHSIAQWEEEVTMRRMVRNKAEQRRRRENELRILANRAAQLGEELKEINIRLGVYDK